MERLTRNPWRRFGLSARAGWLLVAGYGLGAVLVVASTWLGWRGAYATQPTNEFVTVLCLVFGAACAGLAARRRRGRHRLGWLALVTALLGWAVGEVIWAVLEVRPAFEHAAHPAAAEVVLLLYPLGAIATLVLLSSPIRRIPWHLILDGVIVATSLFVVSWVSVLRKLVMEGSAPQVATLIHVGADVIVMTTAIIAFSRARAENRLSLSVVAGGVMTIGVADLLIVFHSGMGSYHSGDLVDVTRIVGTCMIALAALASINEPPVLAHPDEARVVIRSRARLWLPYLPLLLAAVVCMGEAVGQMMVHRPILTIELGILVAAVLARQFVVLLENQGLLKEVAQEAFRDSLTGLANRAHFLRRLEQAVSYQRRNGATIAVLCLDLDNFKSVNDALGHPAGDELLTRVADRLVTAVEEAGLVARLGGDEFAVLIEKSVEEAQATAQRVLECFSAAIVIDGVPLTVRPSIGFTVATASSSCTVDELLRHADLAMYAAKREGGQCIRSFVPITDNAMSTVKESPGSPGHRGAGVITGLSGTRQPARTARPFAEVAASPPGQVSDVSQGIRWPPTAVRIALALLGIGVLAFAVASVVFQDTDDNVFLAKFLYPALNLLPALVVAVRAWRVPADRFAWILIAAGTMSSAVGDIIYAAWVPDGQSPSAAEPAYLALYPLLFAGLLLLMRGRLRRVPIPVRLDSVVCGLAMAAVAAALTSGPIHAAASRTPATVLVGLIYPWGDLILLALAAGMLPILGWRNELRWGLLALGFVLFAAADTAYLFETSAGAYRAGTVLDACWPASAYFVALASWAPSSPAPPLAKRGLGSYLVPVGCTVLALGVTILGHNSLSATTLAALTLVAVAARFSVTFRDVSVLAESHKQAMTDELTALPNRRSLATALTAAPVHPPSLAARMPSRRALLLLELYEFQEINASIGRHFGDDLLCHIANRLTANVRRADLLARVGDNEFAILLSEGADLIAARAQAGRLLEVLSEPFALDPITVQVDARVAIALYPDHCEHPQELLTHAETAIPHAKSTKGKIAVYDPAFELYRENDPNVIEDLRSALSDADELTCHYQPKINARDDSIHSLEALLRWHHPSRGLLLPEEFLPAAERAGLMRQVAHRTVNLALAQIRSWRDQGISLTVAVNLSTANLLDLDLVGTIERLLQTHDLPPDALIIEITESTLVDSARSRNTVASLRRLGVRISLDDYGTGWSSLARLQDVSVDELKLDRRFVARLAQDPRSVAIVRSTVALAQSLGADLVAEGVEDEVTLSAVRRYGCTITQGFVHSPPLPAAAMLQWITAHSPDAAAPQARQAGMVE